MPSVSTSSTGSRGHAMRASDLLGRVVVGPAGEPLGKGLDIRVVQDGPMLGAFAALRIDGLVVGKRALTSRLGYDRAHTSGPALVAFVVRRLMSANRYLLWDDVEDVGAVIRSGMADLEGVPSLP